MAVPDPENRAGATRQGQTRRETGTQSHRTPMRELAGPPKVVARDVPQATAGESRARTVVRAPPRRDHRHRPRQRRRRGGSAARPGRAGHPDRRLQPQRCAQPGRPEPHLGHALRRRSRRPHRAAVHRLQHGRRLHGSLWAARPGRAAVEGAEQGLRCAAAAERPAERLDARQRADRLRARQRRAPARAAGTDEA
jgi:hypothetical protein